MKILYLTPQAPNLTSGGGRHCYANLRSLCEFKDTVVDYIGPAFESDIKGLQRENLSIIVARSFTPKDRIISAFKGAPSSLVQVFSGTRKQVDFRTYNLVFIEFSYIDFIFSYLQRNTPTICCVHNVEADYQKANCTGLRRLKYYYVKKCERKVVQSAANLLVMHEHDARRLESVYQTKLDNYTIHPVCSFSPRYDIVNMDEREKIILFSGSLDSIYNEVGLLEFLNRCWKKIQDCGYTLLVSGRNPSIKIISALGRYRNAEIIANPLDMEKLIKNARLLVLPDLYGTGMKLRIAEALSYGVPVVGTLLGLRGYNHVESFGAAVESIHDMNDAVLTLIESTERLKELSLSAIELWKHNYTFKAFRSRIHSILDSL